jgi:glycosyltransferase involved in cell wall biosynthesis
MPRISVVMNVYNGAETVREALDSVLGQSFTDWELIFWDDQSTDGSASVLRGYTDQRIRYFLSSEFTSLGRAREQAIHQAAGEWLAFLDQDDIWLSNKLRDQIALADDPAVGLIYGRTVRFQAYGGDRDYDHRHEFQPLPEGDLFDKLIVDACFICMSSAMLRRTFALEAGPIPDTIQMTPDYFLFLTIARRSRVRVVQEVVCRYRWHEGNMSRAVLCRIQEEIIWLVDQWSESLDPALADRRRRVHSTVWAVQEMRNGKTFRLGLARLLRNGSLRYLVSRPFAIAYRSLRRKVCRPTWKETQPGLRIAPFSSTRNCDTASGDTDELRRQ